MLPIGIVPPHEGLPVAFHTIKVLVLLLSPQAAADLHLLPVSRYWSQRESWSTCLMESDMDTILTGVQMCSRIPSQINDLDVWGGLTSSQHFCAGLDIRGILPNEA